MTGELMDAEAHRVASGPHDLDPVRLAVKMGNGSVIPTIGAFLGHEASGLLVEFYCWRL